MDFQIVRAVMDPMPKRGNKTDSAKPKPSNQFSGIPQALEAGMGHLGAGRMLEAEGIYRQILEVDPKHPVALNMLGVIANQAGKKDIAVELITQSIASKPDSAEAHSNLGVVLQEMGSLEDAVASFENALALKPGFADAHRNLGSVLQDLGRLEDAIASFRKGLDFSPDYAKANIHAKLGYALNALGRRKEALDHLNMNLELNRVKNFLDPNDVSIRFISKPKINHDIEQFRYLESLGNEYERFGKLAETYETLRDEIDWSGGDGFLVPFTEDQRRKVNDTYGRPFHLAEAPELPGSTVNGDLDVAGITSRYFGNSPGLVFFEDLLTPEALAAIRRFLLESTIWFHVKKNGYVGTYMQDGMACPLLLQIAEDIRRAFPDIIKDHPLKQFWSYKYGPAEKGINIHADDAAVNLNFWVSPDSANLKPGTGGLVVYMVEAPEDWPHNVYYTGDDTSHIFEYLKRHESSKQVVPHGENRGVMFNSDLFHETDVIDFKPGYENHRISVTMLYGNREY